MKLGKLEFDVIRSDDPRVAPVVSRGAQQSRIIDEVFVTEIDPSLSDTAVFCEKYAIDPGISTNCLVIEAKRADRVWYAVCLALASDSADINGVVRRTLDARKTSFASMETALQHTNMEYGGITPIGLPDDWTILIDEAVTQQDVVVIGGGVRASKIAIKPTILSGLAHAQVLNLKKEAK